MPPVAAWTFRHGLLFGEVLVAGDPPVGVTIAYRVGAPVFAEERVAASLGDLRERLGEDGWAGYARVEAPWRAADARLAAALPGPHWYLDMVAVAPERQGAGIGTALIAAVHARADADGRPTGLLTFQPRNRPLYERLGYALVGAGPDPASGVDFWCYRRPPR